MKYRLLALDVDGTLTDGSIYVSGDGEEFKKFDIQDGMGLSLFRKAGGDVALISGRYSSATEKRAKELGIDFLVNGTAQKLAVLKKIASKLKIPATEVVYAGDDVNDIECAIWAGLGVAVNNAVPELKKVADLVTKRDGGSGAIREIVDTILNLSSQEEGSK